jgi:hypothetical protein
MFTEAGCDDQHLSELAVKGSKLPNVICLLPGSSDKVIIVGAHILHSSKDNISAMRLDDYYQTYRLLAAYVAYLDQGASVPTPQTTH